MRRGTDASGVVVLLLLNQRIMSGFPGGFVIVVRASWSVIECPIVVSSVSVLGRSFYVYQHVIFFPIT